MSGKARSALGLEQFIAVSTIFDAAQIVLYVADMETHELLFLNRHAEAIWGSDSVGRKCHAVLQNEPDPCSFCTNARLVVDGQPAAPVVWEFQNRVDRHWYLCIDKAIPWSDGRLVRMEVAIDITARKADEAFREQYVSLISHDLRSPLSTISYSASALQLLLADPVSEATAKPLDAILRSSQRMAGMIDELLESSRLESGRLQLKPSAFDLNDLARSVMERMGAEASRPIRMETEGPAPVLADYAGLERVMENLVGNAFRYSPEGSAVTVRIEKHGRETIVSVVDEGVGIPPHELPRLFNRFYRASGSNVKGLGLGLYNSRLIVESHGGRIWAENRAGPGSVFRFAIPSA